jgi:hypothetical protein
VHLVGIALLVGSIVITDLRLLGFALRRYTVREVSTTFRIRNHAGLAIMLTTGPILFLADTTRYMNNPAFLFKMAALAAALVFHFSVHLRPERHGRFTAIVSIALWTLVVLGGRAIADFDI